MSMLLRRHLKGFFISSLIIWTYIVFNFYNLHLSSSPDDEDVKYEVIRAADIGIQRSKVPPPTVAPLPSATTSNISSLFPKNESLCELKDPSNAICLNKINWVKSFWKSEPCYAELGVDGGLCSIRYYLSQVENYCPPMDWMTITQAQPPLMRRVEASFNTNLDPLTSFMSESRSAGNYEWMIRRMRRLWHLWAGAVEFLEPIKKTSRTQKRILIYLGFLSKKSGFKIQQSASEGGPLGELVQWSDILSVFHLLGHQLTIASEYDELRSKLSQLPNMKSQCQVSKNIPYDVIVTDIVGLNHFKKHLGSGYAKFSCMLWIIDSFGTEAAFNHRTYHSTHKTYRSNWGKHELKLKQFFTMFPHSPDNSFMGFVVEQHFPKNNTPIVKKQQAVVYGKALFMWNEKDKYLETIGKHVSVHGTVYTDSKSAPKKPSSLPPFVINHGILSGPQLQNLLLESKLFIGLGFPYEGPAPLEAIAAGCVFISPSFNPPHNADNTKFFKGKPTKRGLTSQHPYAEDFISYPNVLTVDMMNLKEVDRVVKLALELIDNETVQGYLPREFTHVGMLERVNAYLEHQDFCRHDEPWPPVSSIQVLVALENHSCKQACWSKKLLCEPSHFERLNTEEVLRQHLQCKYVETKRDLFYPGFDSASQACVLQQDPLLFSCVDRLAGFQRLCPCRNFVRGQMALCKECL